MVDDPHPAGWFRDPFDPERLRYWDGEVWTEHVAEPEVPAAPSEATDAPIVAPEVAEPVVPAAPIVADVPAPPIVPANPSLPAEGTGDRRKLAAAVAVVAALVAGGAWFVLSGDDDTPVAVDAATTTTAPTTTLAATTTTTAAPTTSAAPATTTSTTSTTSTTTTTTTLPPECNDLTETIPPSSFTDIGAVNEEASMAVAWAQSIGLVSLGDGSFRPTDPMSRAEVMTVLWRYFCGPTPSSSAGFVDVPAEAFFAAPVDWAAGAGIISGTDPTTFSPDAAISRAQFVTVAWRAVGSPTGTPPAPFTDTAPGSFYSAALDWAFDVGVVSGRSPTEFAPDDPLDRLTTIVLFWRLETIIDPAVT